MDFTVKVTLSERSCCSKTAAANGAKDLTLSRNNLGSETNKTFGFYDHYYVRKSKRDTGVLYKADSMRKVYEIMKLYFMILACK